MDFVSFLCSVKHNKIVCGNPLHHMASPIHSGDGDWRECEWLPCNKIPWVRVHANEDRTAYVATILSKVQTRHDLVEYLSPSRDLWNVEYHFNTLGFHRVSGPAIIYPSGSVEYWVNGSRLKCTR